MVATVLGAGTMGAQIAAHLANAGIATHLLDIVPKGVPDGAPAKLRNGQALGALKVMAKGKPPPFMDPRFSARIRPGNLQDDLEKAVAKSDLVIEAVVERLDIKRDLFAKVAAAAPAHAVLATNTSGLPVTEIAQELPAGARERVVGMHFFNPPRYMTLLEVVPGAHTSDAVVQALTRFGERVLGKGTVLCRDTPNFIANRIGTAEMALGFAAAENGYTVEEIDLLNGPLMGRPKTGTCRLGDLVGIDIAAHVTKNLAAATSDDPADANYDELRGSLKIPAYMEQMLEKGLLGDKTGKGFYRKTRDAKGKRVIESLDLQSLEYRGRQEPAFAELAPVAKIPKLEERAAAALRVEGRAGDFLRQLYLALWNYAANRVGKICETPKQIDDAMCWGYGWKLGPFALWDAVGLAWSVEQMRSAGLEPAPAVLELLEKEGDDARWYGRGDGGRNVYVPGEGRQTLGTPAGALLLDDRRGLPEIHTTATAGLIDLGDGVACLEFRSKMNIFDEGVIEMIEQAVPKLIESGNFQGLVVGNQGDQFSAGADLTRLLAWAEAGDWKAIETAVARFQDMLMGLRHAAVPVVSAPHSLCLGGGAELTLSCAAAEPHAELYMGLVEAGVGLLPAGGGLKELVRRAAQWASAVPDGDPYPHLRRSFEVVGGAKTSSSAHDAKNLGLLSPETRVTFSRGRVLAAAKARALSLAAAGWEAPDRNEPIPVVGAPRGSSFEFGATLFQWGGYISEHDALIGRKIAHVLSGGMAVAASTVTAQDLLDLEREAFVSLCGEEKTRARLAHTLKTGKPLRN